MAHLPGRSLIVATYALLALAACPDSRVAGPDAAKCVIGCAAKDAAYVVASEGKLYKFEKKNDFYKNFAGKK